jgi:glycerophosphoryl diester phosphodiesterase
MEIIGHRGYPFSYPENTLLSFKKAIECGADGVEMDVHLAKDGKPVIFHDFNLKRLTGIDDFIFNIPSYSLKRIKVKGTEETIPLFDDVIHALNKSKIFLELKTIDERGNFYYSSIEKIIADRIEEYDLYDNLTVISFDPFVLERLRKYDDKIKIGLDFERESEKIFNREKLPEYAERISLDYFLPEWQLLKDDEFISNEMPKSSEIYCWTLNDVSKVEQLKVKIKGIITDKCCEIKKERF